jgi:hypothetical protein
VSIRLIDKPSKVQSQFIGEVFNVEGKGTLKVTNVYKKNNNTLFSVECSVCSEDLELFPENEMLISKNNLKNGKYPCQCSSGWKPSLYQYKILISRFKSKKDLSVILGGDLYVTVNTEGYGTWSCHVTQYLQGKRSYKESLKIRNEKLRISDEDYSERFMKSGKFLEGTKFWRSDRKDTRGYSVYWKYYCPVCSNDEYVKNGLCSGEFESCSSTLKEGNKSCRCVSTFRWTKEQREYQLKPIFEKEDLTFLGWDSEYTGAFTKIRWLCKEDHYNNTELSNFLHLNHRCSTCAEGLWGYYKNREEDVDSLYLLRFTDQNETFYKVGRTFKIKERLKYFQKFYNVTLISKIENYHKEIYKLESALKTKLTSYRILYSPKIDFDGSLTECFTKEILSHPEIISTFNLPPKDT